MGKPAPQENARPPSRRPCLAAIAVAVAFFLPLLFTALVLRWTWASIPSAGPSRGEAALYRATDPSGRVGFRSVCLVDPQMLALRPEVESPLLAVKGTSVFQETSRDVIFYAETPAGLGQAGLLRGDGLYTYSPTLPILSPAETSSGTVAVAWSYGPWRYSFPLDYALRRLPESPLSTPAGTFSQSLPVELDIRIGPDTFHHRIWYVGEGGLFPLLHEESGPAGLRRYELLSATWLPPGSGTAAPADEIGPSGFTYLERAGPGRSGALPQISALPSLSLYWQASFPNDITSPLLCAAGLFLFGDEAGRLWAMDVGRGEVRWTFDTGRPILAAPAVSGGIVYIAAGERLYALEAENGLFLWSASADDRIVASPLLLGDLLYFGTEGGTFYALEARRGTERWRFEAGDAILTPAVGSQDTVLFGDASGLLYALDAVRGTLRWRIELEQTLGPPSIAGGTVYVGLSGGMEGGRMTALSLEDGSIRWSTALSGGVSSALAVGDEVIYAVTDLGYVVALGQEDGRLRWQVRLEGIPNAPLLVGRTLVLADAAGSVHLLDMESGEERAVRSDLTPFGAPPDFCQNLVFLADRHRHIYALGGPAGLSLRLIPRWDRPAVEESSGAGPAGSPQEWAGRPLLLLDNGDLRLYDPSSGEFILLAELGGFADLPPRVHGDTAYIALSHLETGEISTTLVAYNLAGREVRWKRGLGGFLRFSPAATSSHVLLCLDTLSGGRLLALDASGGATLWENPLSTCTGAPLVEDGHVFLAAGQLGAWDLDTGESLWLSSAAFVQGTPVRCGEMLYAGLLKEEGFSLAAFDPLSGQMRWKGPARPALFLRPACDPPAGGVLVGWSDGLLQAYAGDTGTPLWSHESGDLLLSDLVVEEGVVYGVTGEGALLALDVERGRLLARHTPPYTVPALTSPLVMDGELFFADRIFLYALEVVHE